MYRLDNHADPFWFEHGIDRIDDPSAQFLSNLQAAGERLRHARRAAGMGLSLNPRPMPLWPMPLNQLNRRFYGPHTSQSTGRKPPDFG
jgi:hypothetical protein